MHSSNTLPHTTAIIQHYVPICYIDSAILSTSIVDISSVYRRNKHNKIRVRFSGCKYRQFQLECLHYSQLHLDKCELQYHQLWPEAAACRTMAPQVRRSMHSREGLHSPDHPRVGHLQRVHLTNLAQDSHFHKNSHFPQRRE